MKIEIEGAESLGYFISISFNGGWLHSSEIDKVLKDYSDFSYSELALKFGAYIDDSYESEEVYFLNLEDAVRIRDFLYEITS